MNKHFLKNIRDNIPEFLKIFTASLFRYKLINNREFCRYYKLLEDRESLSPESIKEYQLNQLKYILTYSYQNVQYYHELFNRISFDPLRFSDFQQLEEIPFLTREIINDNFNKLISKEKVKNGYYVGTTGGSSGFPLKFLLDYDSIYKENAFIYFYRRRLGYGLNDKLATFRQVDFKGKFWKTNPMHNEVLFSPIKLSKVTIVDYAKKINDFKPDYFNGYLSVIWYFAKLLEEYNIKLNFKLKGIFLISENIDLNQRSFIENFFACGSSTFYGHSERCVIAEEINPGRYLFDPYYGYTEQVNSGNNNFTIVGTGFLNRCMPFIRYKTDDICFPENQYYAIEGKRSSTIGLLGYNNEFLSSAAFDLDKELFKNITTYQFIQNEKGKADMLIVVNKHFKISDIELIKNDLNTDTEGVIDIDIKLVDHLILTERGKYQMYISNIKKA